VNSYPAIVPARAKDITAIEALTLAQWHAHQINSIWPPSSDEDRVRFVAHATACQALAQLASALSLSDLAAVAHRTAVHFEVV
jgi:hypothetical protein